MFVLRGGGIHVQCSGETSTRTSQRNPDTLKSKLPAAPPRRGVGGGGDTVGVDGVEEGGGQGPEAGRVLPRVQKHAGGGGDGAVWCVCAPGRVGGLMPRTNAPLRYIFGSDNS